LAVPPTVDISGGSAATGVVIALTQVRHGTVENSVNLFRMSSGYR
jgi:hypothetical protein